MKKINLLFAAMLVCVLPAVAQSVSEPDVDLSVETASSDSDYVLVADSLLLATIAEQADSLAQVADSASNAALPVVETADAAVGEVADAVSEVAEDSAVELVVMRDHQELPARQRVRRGEGERHVAVGIRLQVREEERRLLQVRARRDIRLRA